MWHLADTMSTKSGQWKKFGFHDLAPNTELV